MSVGSELVRPLIGGVNAYVPGEQPKIAGLIKLNTNENPYPPSTKVLKAVKSATDSRLRLYPNPTADRLRAKLAKHHGCRPENIIVGNGSDELLALATRVFVEPVECGDVSPLSTAPKTNNAATRRRTPRSRSIIQYFTPSYSLYPVLADIHGAAKKPVPLETDFSMPTVENLRREGRWNFNAALTYITTPNAPSGRGYSSAELEALARAHSGVLILDEAYVDFANEDALQLGLKFPHVLVARTFSKGYSLCFLRVGYFVGNPELIAALHTVRDSYNVNGLGQIAAEATLGDLQYYRKNFRRIIATRERAVEALSELGFQTFPSETNFVFTRPPLYPAGEWLEKLRARKILVRWWSYPEVRDYLRITIGTDNEMDKLLQVIRQIISKRGKVRR